MERRGGLGVLTKPKSGKSCGAFTDEEPIALNEIDPITGLSLDPAVAINGLDRPLKELNEVAANSCKHDEWDDVDDYIKSIRPPLGLRKLDKSKVTRGREVFQESGCQKCHGGAGWTLSRRFYEPSKTKNDSLKNVDNYTKGANVPDAQVPHAGGKQIAPQPASADTSVVQPGQVACTIRNVGTFADDALELRENGNRAQGKGGYNVPSLYGMSLGAPYLHAGQAKTLEELFALNSAAYRTHNTAGSGNALLEEADKDALISFILSIDSGTDEIAVPSGFDGCP